ncbi:protein TonB [Variovorax sp. 54]|uniref:TonB family protein n=1 Tax=Variovorax sp. 54 TaxID=2035212 RepID=UPI000C1A7FE9|nr:TonB family protein [Variovorax sp. 54]PIF78186.1 protein TonB [Variovorax sp. 54]
MNDVPGFLLALGLRPDADERAIRRAYASELKKIDQEAEAEAFQRLRETYEAALTWARHKPQTDAPVAQEPPPEPAESEAQNVHSSPIDATPAGPPSAAPQATSPHESAHAVVAAFAGRLAEHPPRSIDDAATLLNTSLEDDRLLDMDARFLFEANVAHILASGWQAGHEHLFEAAAEAFEWRKDSARLQRLGKAGQVVDAAIVEQHAHADLPTAHRELQLKYLDLLRRRSNPGEEAVTLGLDHVLHAAGLFPNWVRLTSKTENIVAWQKVDADTASSAFGPSPRRASPATDAPHTPLKPSQLVAWFAIFCVGSMLFVLLQSAFKWQGEKMPTSGPLASQAVQAPPQRAAPPATAIPTSPTPPSFTAPRASVALSDAPRAEYSVAPRPVYPSLSKRFGEQGKVLVKVLPDSDGVVRGIRVAQSSGYERLDAAAVDAVKAARLVIPKDKADKTGSTWYMAPINFVLNDGAQPAARRDWGQMVAAAVRPNIIFAADVRGNPTVEFTLDLAPSGKILNATLLKSSGIPEWDNAALRAIRKTEYMPLPDQGAVPSQMVLALRPKNS